MISYIRAGLVLAVLGLAAWGGWTARAWLEDSRALDQAREERDKAIERERAAETRATEAEARAKEAEKIRGQIAGDLEKERAKIHETTRPIIKRIPVYVDRGNCSLGVDGVRDLNAARGAVVPNAERRIAGETYTRRADPGL